MSMWTAIALISVAGILGGIFRERGSKNLNRENASELEALGDRLDALENDLRERVETLERIVTSSKDDLKRQFDQLDKAS